MSTDYSKMSDFEINKLVALASGKNIKFISVDADDNEIGVIVGEKCTRQRLPFDPCNSPADAWPIIVANLIEVSPDYDFTDESEQELHATGLWTANHVEVDGKSYYQSHQNPLRASMIVFLMMQESKNAS